MTGPGFVPMGGYGAAYEAAAMRLGLFAVKDLRAAVVSVRPPSLDSATEWVRRQVEAGAVVKVWMESSRFPALYAVTELRRKKNVNNYTDKEEE